MRTNSNNNSCVVVCCECCFFWTQAILQKRCRRSSSTMCDAASPPAAPSKWAVVRSAYGAIERANELKTIGTGLVGSVSDEVQAKLRNSSSFAEVDAPEGEGPLGATLGAMMKFAWRRKVKRVGVPGGVALDFGFKTICSWYGSSFQAALASVSTLCHVILFGALVAASISLDFRVNVPSEALKMLQFAATFSLVFYSGQVLNRFTQRFDTFCQTNGSLTLVTCMAAGQMRHEKARAALLMRYANLIMHLNYLALNGPLDESKWQLMLDRGLLTPFEKEQLVPLKKRSSTVFVWAIRILHQLASEGKLTRHAAERIEMNLSNVRGLSAKQIAYQVCAIPKPYFHLMTMLTHLYLVLELLSASGRVADAWTLIDDDEKSWPLQFVVEISCTLISVVVLMAMWRTAIWLSDPVGDDVTDYDIDFDLRNLWAESLEVLSQMKVSTDMDDLADRVLKQALSPVPRKPIDAGGSTRASSVLTKLMGKKAPMEAGAALSEPMALTRAASVAYVPPTPTTDQASSMNAHAHA